MVVGPSEKCLIDSYLAIGYYGFAIKKKHLPPQLSSLCLVLEKINPAPPLVG